MNDEYLNELATEIEDYIKNHNDSKFLDLTELDISLDILKGIIEKLDRGLFSDIEQTNNCNNCVHFKSGDSNWEDICNKDWDCIHYYNRPNRWEGVK